MPDTTAGSSAPQSLKFNTIRPNPWGVILLLQDGTL